LQLTDSASGDLSGAVISQLMPGFILLRLAFVPPIIT